MLILFLKMLVRPDSHSVNNQSNSVIELVFFVFQAFLSVFLSIGYFRLLDLLLDLFHGFLPIVERFEQIAAQAGLPPETIVIIRRKLAV
jgi:hypothetical protein